MNLIDWKSWKGYSLKEAAEVLGITESFLSLLLRKKRGVSPEMALQIEERTENAVRKDEIMWQGKEV